MSRPSGASRRGNMRHGLVSLLTVVVVLSLATAAVLAVATSHAMAALAQRQATMTSEGYAAERSAQAFIAKLDEALLDVRGAKASQKRVRSLVDKQANSLLASACEEGVYATYALEDGTLTCTFITEGGRMLQTTVEIADDATYDVVGWRLTAAPQEEDTGDTLWTGTAAEQ